MYFVRRLLLLFGKTPPDPPDCAMKPIDSITDEELAALAQRAAALPDAPRDAIDAAKALYDHRGDAPGPCRDGMVDVARSGARLLAAVLRFDSWAGGSAVRLGMRSLPAETRHLLFSAMGRDIDLRIAPAEEQFALTGQVLGPDEAGRAELACAGSADMRVAAIDELGEFRLDGLTQGTYLLTLRMGRDEIALPPIEVGSRHG